MLEYINTVLLTKQGTSIMGWLIVSITVFLIPALAAGQFPVNPVCGENRFIYEIQGNCTTTSCPGDCTTGACCVKQCFDFKDAKEVQTQCISQNSTASCSGFEAEMQCVADLYNSTVNICRQQVWLLNQHSFLQGDLNPRNCPCKPGYSKFLGDDPIFASLCAGDGMCYNVTDTIQNVTALCLNDTIAPGPDACAEDERLDDLIVALTFQECTEICTGQCRNVTDKLPACCVDVKTGDRHTPEDDDEDDSLHVGYVILIVVVVLIFITVVLFGALYFTRYRQLLNTKMQPKDNFTDIAVDSAV